MVGRAVVSAPRRISLLGATGSVGATTRKVVASAPDRHRIVAVAGGRDAEALARAAIETGAEFAAIADARAYPALKAALAGTRIKTGAGPQAMVEAALWPCDLVVAAIVGTAGVLPAHAALQAGRRVALANKETLVCAGAPVMRDAAAAGAVILPLDSEHNAIFQALAGAPAASIEDMTLTASGGPFRTWSAAQIAGATREQALTHPNWSMGPKITVDSATMMNKGLELIEAHHLFGVPADKLRVVVHPQSIIHGMVSFADGMVIAGLACPDMAVPVAHCLGWPERLAFPAKRLDLAALGALTFEAPDPARFPALALAMAALRAGQGLPTILNAANEAAVERFIAGGLRFTDIARLVEQTCEQCLAAGEAREPGSVAEALELHALAQARTRALLPQATPSAAFAD